MKETSLINPSCLKYRNDYALGIKSNWANEHKAKCQYCQNYSNSMPNEHKNITHLLPNNIPHQSRWENIKTRIAFEENLQAKHNQQSNLVKSWFPLVERLSINGFCFIMIIICMHFTVPDEPIDLRKHKKIVKTIAIRFAKFSKSINLSPTTNSTIQIIGGQK